MQRFHKVLNCVSILIEGRQPELSNHQGQTTTEFLYKKLANFGTSDATKTNSHILGRRRGGGDLSAIMGAKHRMDVLWPLMRYVPQNKTINFYADDIIILMSYKISVFFSVFSVTFMFIALSELNTTNE